MNFIDEKEFLDHYSDKEFKKPSVTVDAVILRIKSVENKNYRKLPEKKLQVFLHKRTKQPNASKFSIVGTFVDLKNELSHTLKQTVENRLNLKNFYYEQLFTFGERLRDPRTRVLSVSYMLLTNENESPENGEWFDVDISEKSADIKQNDNGFSFNKVIELTLSNNNHTLKNIISVNIEKENLQETKTITLQKNDLAFDHAKIIYYAFERLKNKLEYTDIVFNLLPKKFTLTELKQVFEVILQQKLLDANFRRKVAKMVIATDDFVEGKGHRTSQLFAHNPNWALNNLD